VDGSCGISDHKWLMLSSEVDECKPLLEGMSHHMEDPAHPNVPFDPKDLRLVNDFDQAGMSYENAIYTIMQQVRSITSYPISATYVRETEHGTTRHPP